jgi:AcrR family transcriptional regulator
MQPVPTTPRRKNKSVRTRLHPDVRRQLIVEVAFRAVADEGLEGLRTRNIARLAGINSATLHHYFPSKEDLVAAVALHLENRLRSEKSRSPEGEAGSRAVTAVDHQFQDVLLYHLERPDVLAVYREFVARASRDPAIRALVDRLHAGWRLEITHALKRGMDQGALRADLDVDAAASLVLSTAWGFASHILSSPDDLMAAGRQLKSCFRASTSKMDKRQSGAVPRASRRRTVTSA